MLGTAALALVAGILSILSPCVLPLLPLVFGATTSRARFGAVALGGGVAVSFVAIGLFVATIGFGIGLNGDSFRLIAAVLMIGIGAVLLVPHLQLQFVAASGPVGNWVHGLLSDASDDEASTGTFRQFGVGLLLGTAWSPCVGPTLGAASILAAQGKDLPQVALTMLAFGFGAALPLALIGAMSRTALTHWRGRFVAAGGGFKIALGVLLVVFGVLIVSGFDKRLEATLVDASPQWLTDLTTRY